MKKISHYFLIRKSSISEDRKGFCDQTSKPGVNVVEIYVYTVIKRQGFFWTGNPFYTDLWMEENVHSVLVFLLRDQWDPQPEEQTKLESELTLKYGGNGFSHFQL